MKKIIALIFLITVVTLISGCNANQVAINNQNTESLNTQPVIPETPKTTVTYFVSPNEYIKYCNGEDMDSAGYKKSITRKMSNLVEGDDLSLEQKAKIAINEASALANLGDITSIDNNYLKISGNTAYLKPVEGWAGVSIFLCAWQPLVEVNLLQYPEIKKIIWLDDFKKWDEIK